MEIHAKLRQASYWIGQTVCSSFRKPQTFWPTQYYAGNAVLSLNRLWHSGERYMQVYSGSCMYVVGHFNITAWSLHLNIPFLVVPSLPNLSKMSPFCSISYHLFVFFFLLRTYHLTYYMLYLHIFNLTSPLESKFCMPKCVSLNAVSLMPRTSLVSSMYSVNVCFMNAC